MSLLSWIFRPRDATPSVLPIPLPSPRRRLSRRRRSSPPKVAVNRLQKGSPIVALHHDGAGSEPRAIDAGNGAIAAGLVFRSPDG